METAPTLFTAVDWANWLAEAARRLREVYKLSPERLIAEYRREREITRGYHGREVLELLQNAGDAARLAEAPGRVRIVVTSQGLVMGNTGRAFDKGGVQSLQTANLSPKRQRDAVVIGDKGLGFRSILNWTHSPLISSGKLGLAFLPGYAAEIVRGLETESEDLAQRVADEQRIAGDLILPRLAFPQWIPHWAKHAWPDDEGLRSIAIACSTLRNDGFDTAVGMPFSTPQAYREAVQQVDELKPEFLLLVDSIARLDIQIEGRNDKVWSCDWSERRRIIREGGRDISSWTVSSFDGEVPGELLDTEEQTKNRFQLKIAVPDEGQAGPSCLFCYFPTEVQIPLPLLAHATVELDETRKHLNDTRANRYILQVLATKIADLAELETGRVGADAWAGCQLVTPVGGWGSELVQFGFTTALHEAAQGKKLVPVLVGGHRTAKDAKRVSGDETKWWPQRLFPEIAAIKNKNESARAEHLKVEVLPPEQIEQRLLAAGDLTLEERAYAIAGLLQGGNQPVGDNLSTLLCDETATPLPIGVSRSYTSVEEHKIKPYEMRHLKKHQLVLVHCERGFKRTVLAPLEPDGEISSWYKGNWF